MLRRIGRWPLFLVVAMFVVAALIVFAPWSGLLPEETAASGGARDRGELAVTDLNETVETDGLLRVREQRTITASGGGTLTAIAETSEPVEAGTVLFAVDGVPTVALVGDMPAWRAMTIGDVGADVAQLEANLVAMGYDPDEELTVDDTFTNVTSAVVERWQHDLGVETTGAVSFDSQGLGSVVFIPEGWEVAAVNGVAGEAVQGAPLLSLSSSERELSFDVPADRLDTISVGTDVSARLPDRSVVDATVAEIGPTGTGGWEAVATLTSPTELSGSAGQNGDTDVVLPEGDAIPLTVSWVDEIATDVTAVRASSLVRVDSGGYAVEVVGPSESTTFVEVEVGARSGSTVEILTDLPPGTVIITP